MPTLIIGISGHARSGKDTVANAILNEFGDKYEIKRYALADALKLGLLGRDLAELCLRYGIPYDFSAPMDDPLCPPPHGKQRKLLQFLGTEVGRSKDPYYWIKKLKARLDAEQPAVALVTDIRFPNEMLWVKANGGIMIRVQRTDEVDLSLEAKHSSETALDRAPNGLNWDYDIKVPSGHVDELKQDAIDVFKMIIAASGPREEVTDETEGADSSDPAPDEVKDARAA